MDKENKKNQLVKSIAAYLGVIVLAILIKVFIFTPIRVNGNSMFPTLHDGDLMILNEIGYRINGFQRFDIVVADIDGEKVIKRVIGLPGETVEYRDNNLYINGKQMMENFTHSDTKDFTLDKFNEKVIPKNYYFLVGDNREVSKDSRTFGFISGAKIKGKTNLIIFPFDRVSTAH